MCSRIKNNNLPWDYVERMQILEKENQRLMTAQGHMVQETNRKCEVRKKYSQVRNKLFSLCLLVLFK